MWPAAAAWPRRELTSHLSPITFHQSLLTREAKPSAYRGVTTRVTMALKFAASILHPSTKSSGPCSISTTQQKVAPRKTMDQAKSRKMVGSTGNS
jgi:hypothetical protein